MNHPARQPAEDKPAITLRPAQAGDEPFLLALYVEARREEFAPLGWDEAMLANFLGMQFRAQRMGYAGAYPEASWSIIQHGSEPVGRLMVHRAADRICLVDIALLPGWRGQGIGGSLITNLQAEAREARKPLRLSVLPHNPAARLYERLGFVKTGVDGPSDAMEWRA
jgi:ribosomal protein S18 acetylase RimI-like enzyme